MDCCAISRLKRCILQTAYRAKEGHIASAFSILDIVWVLYSGVLRYDSQNPRAQERDRFILSKGHGSLALYAVLAEKGFFSPTLLETFALRDSLLGGHPDRNKIPGVEACTGSLGHGLPMAVGIALGLRINGAGQRVFCLVGDGECNEGSIWEACLLAAHHRLSSLCCIVDFNHSTDRAVNLGDLEGKFRSFGFEVIVVDGHDHEMIAAALAPTAWTGPRVVIAETVKGKGCAQMENDPAWHHRVPSAAELENMLKEVSKSCDASS